MTDSFTVGSKPLSEWRCHSTVLFDQMPEPDPSTWMGMLHGVPFYIQCSTFVVLNFACGTSGKQGLTQAAPFSLDMPARENAAYQQRQPEYQLIAETLDFLPGAAFGTIPDNLQRMPSILWPSSNRVE
jgi:hypothetical protein